jgi:hypothetical protein
MHWSPVWHPKAVPGPEQQISPGLQHFPLQHDPTPSGQHMPGPEGSGLQATVPGLQLEHVFFFGSWHVCPDPQQIPPHSRLEGQHLPATHRSPRGQQRPLHTCDAKEQQRPLPASAQFINSSQQTLPHACSLAQHFPLTHVWPGPQHTPAHTVWVGGQHTTPSLHTSPDLQQALLQMICPLGQQVPVALMHVSLG